MRLRFWLAAVDLMAWCGLFGSRLYLWAVGKASGAADWGPEVTAERAPPW